MPAITHAINKKAVTIQIPDENQPWGQLNRFDAYSRWTIADVEFDDLVNAIPFGTTIRQVPANSTAITTGLPGCVWMKGEILNGGVYIFYLGTDGAIYQIPAAGGTAVNISGATTFSAQTDLANWEGQRIIFTDPAVNKTYTWNGTTFTHETTLDGQPATCITVFSARVWFAWNNTVTYTAGGTYNSLGGDSGAFQIIDEDATQPVVAMFPFNGLLYIFGGNYVQTLGNLTVTGSPAQLTFSKYTIAAEIGTVTRWSIIGYGANIFFASTYGIWTMSGAVPQKLSAQIDGFSFSYDPAKTSYSVGYTVIYQTPVLCWQARVLGEPVGSIFCIVPTIANVYTGITSTSGGWFRLKDTAGLLEMQWITSEVVKNTPTAWFTDGAGNIYTVATNFTTEVTSIFQSKFWCLGNSLQIKKWLKHSIILIGSSSCGGTVDFYDSTLTKRNTVGFSVSAGYIWLDFGGNPYEWDDAGSSPYTWIGPAPNYGVVQMNVDPSYSRILSTVLTMTGLGNALVRYLFETEPSADWGT